MDILFIIRKFGYKFKTMKTQYHFWLSYKIEGSEKERTIVTYAVSERAAKSHVQKCYGKEVKISFNEIIKTEL